MIQAIVFDMDGVLVDSEPANLKQLEDFMRTYGAQPSVSFLHSLVGSSVSYTAIACSKIMHKEWSEDEFNTLFDAYAAKYPVAYLPYVREDVKDTMDYLHEHGLRTAIASSAPLINIQRMLKECHLEDCFDVVLSGEMFAESKPHPEVYLKAAEKLGVDPTFCMAIEDSHFGIAAAKAAGMLTIAYEDTRFGIDQSKADQRIQKLSDIRKLID